MLKEVCLQEKGVLPKNHGDALCALHLKQCTDYNLWIASF